MPTSNFLQFNPTQANQENDAAYTADPTRSGGAGVGAIWPSDSANKTLYQASTFVAAFGQMLAARGFSNSDASLETLQAVLANIVLTGDILAGIATVAWSLTPNFNCATSNGFSLTLSGNPTLTVSGASPGQLIAFVLIQDATGGRTVTYPSNVKGGLQPNPAANSTTVQLFEVGVDSNLYATSTWAQAGFAISLANPGYIKLPAFLGGLILEWGVATSITSTPSIVSFPLVFPTGCISVVATTFGSAGFVTNIEYWNPTGFQVANNSGGVLGASWIAVGY